MNKFEEAICGHNPLYKEGLQDKYYQGAKWAWQSRQAEIEEKDKRIEEALGELRYPTATWDEIISHVINILKGTTNEQ